MATWRKTQLLPPPPRRAHVGCSHRYPTPPAKETFEQRMPHVEDMYREALALLPTQEMPELVKAFASGGGIIGVLNPVSNIVLTAVSCLARRLDATKPLRIDGAELLLENVSRDMELLELLTMDLISSRSLHGVDQFMKHHFRHRHLSKKQRNAYLGLAGYDLVLAVHLAVRDLHGGDAGPDAVVSGRGGDDLRRTLQRARFWAGGDDPALVATSVYPRRLLEAAVAPVMRREKLGCGDVERLLELTRSRRELGDGGGDDGVELVHLTALRPPEEMAALVRSLLEPERLAVALGEPARHPPELAGPCQYIRGLRSWLLHTIHGFYLDALARLPVDALRRHLAGVHDAGHCYGPLDPVSNIILNVIWYGMVVVLKDGGAGPPAAQNGHGGVEYAGHTYPPFAVGCDMLERIGRRSLDGLLAIAARATGAAVNAHAAVEHLCEMGCDVSGHVREAGSDHLSAASSAAGHPKPDDHGAFLASLIPGALDRLRCALAPAPSIGVLSLAAVEQLYTVLHEAYITTQQQDDTAASPPLPPLAEMMERRITAASTVFLHGHRGFLHDALSELMATHAAAHPEEPRYRVHAICGVVMWRGGCYHHHYYHINFFTTPAGAGEEDGAAAAPTLFFAEVGGQWQEDGKSSTTMVLRRDTGRMAHPFWCCPAPRDASHGKCQHCSPSRIVHPLTARYSTNRFFH